MGSQFYANLKLLCVFKLYKIKKLFPSTTRQIQPNLIQKKGKGNPICTNEGTRPLASRKYEL